MSRKKKRTKADNITMRDIRPQNLPILTCPKCARRYIQTEEIQDRCLFCLRQTVDLSTGIDLQYDEESDII